MEVEVMGLVCHFVCMCVCEGEREKEKEKGWFEALLGAAGASIVAASRCRRLLHDASVALRMRGIKVDVLGGGGVVVLRGRLKAGEMHPSARNCIAHPIYTRVCDRWIATGPATGTSRPISRVVVQSCSP